ncbi:MAG: hypothetical protein FJX47_18160, partial [Alphaproteobacteria bacterium]|nr:hypothetical protein [Alphaproteobacteria bacterium]
MTPGARVAAAIEVLEALARGGVADRHLEGYFRKRRYAGSKDRAAISSQVYDVLRRRAALAWALGQGGVNAPAPRQMILAALLSDEMFTGEGHAP